MTAVLASEEFGFYVWISNRSDSKVTVNFKWNPTTEHDARIVTSMPGLYGSLTPRTKIWDSFVAHKIQELTFYEKKARNFV